MTEDRFKETVYKMSYEEYKKCYCPDRESFRRVLEIDGGLGLCPNLKE